MHTEYVDKDTKQTLIAVAIVIVAVSAVLAGIYIASGVRPPQTVVVSDSMQHGHQSNIGVIDTGDMIILKNKNNVEIVSFVEGYVKGHRAFGNYGDVIIYDRGANVNPVIHRAILWLEYNGDGTWSAPILAQYEKGGVKQWTCSVPTATPTRLSGTLTLYNMGAHNDLHPSINLDGLVAAGSPSGYLTMGDNNRYFDQLTSISPGGLVSFERINSVAWFEIPWMGVFKMILDGNKADLNRYVPNSIPALTAMILLFVFVLVGISFLFDHRYYGKFRKELKNDMNAPAPSFRVEEKKEKR